MQDIIRGYRTISPIPLAMGATFDAQLTEDCMEMSAKEAKANGVQVTFARMPGNSSSITVYTWDWDVCTGNLYCICEFDFGKNFP